ncbi:hypothetical protein AJ85_02265 [Alkalihalobacillus alcalophilus ATCC 27647 = CGMCC 1.3604]|uniref:LysM domain-containing protein n=1 Tax=Alkalihalobacillus alcalophilus ATCC 27647 = CGMCC 1.3604 TaxID=1218173 RepID=A0A094YPY4_ALKAL|nr:hypothetical protein [Alkalihalobacillus alcalophilus]KGA95537.1 hypothetical protein BALCAV_0221985 [Alkalihalobacillus alcalophilus ATCC 27647 = CGMCC 1.3604]MED1564088.1 hypothetical protein [Alkalihalobacillus alcalophilus]THG88584.1 hypothetical protein AJ85_02265 [Alkalihalobacillus alcalophilus ATCC 27647 = CGMCC 1.3604]
MKKFLFTIITFITLTSIYYDLTAGTLPEKNSTSAKAAQIQDETQTETTQVIDEVSLYQEVIVEPGYTVLSIVEHLHSGPIPVSIQEVIYDFQQLNKGIEPEKIQIGHTYLFPLYLE